MYYMCNSIRIFYENNPYKICRISKAWLQKFDKLYWKVTNKWKSNKNLYQYPLEGNHMCACTRAHAHTHTHTHTHQKLRELFCPLISKTAGEVQWIMQRTANIKLPLCLRYCTSIFKTCISTPQTPSSTETMQPSNRLSVSPFIIYSIKWGK